MAKKNPDHAKIYDIKLPDWKIATLPRRDNILTEDKLCNGAILADFKEKFYEKWSYSLNKKTQNISLQSTVEAQQNLVNILFECLCISLIFDQGCIHPERLISIHVANLLWFKESCLRFLIHSLISKIWQFLPL